jgi:hypothetical protein
MVEKKMAQPKQNIPWKRKVRYYLVWVLRVLWWIVFIVPILIGAILQALVEWASDLELSFSTYIERERCCWLHGDEYVKQREEEFEKELDRARAYVEQLAKYGPIETNVDNNASVPLN